MLTIHRRHTRECQKKKAHPTKELTKCECPLIVTGMDSQGRYHNREALHTRDVHRAYGIVRGIEEGKTVPQSNDAMGLGEALDKYREILRSQGGCKETTLMHHKTVHNSLVAFAEGRGVKYLGQVTTELLESWIAGWKLADVSRSLYIGRVLNFYEAAISRKWVEDNPCIPITAPKRNMLGSTAPFNANEEMPKILAALPTWEKFLKRRMGRGCGPWGKKPRTTEAFIRLLVCTGMRVSDAFMFDPRELVKREVRGKEVYCYFLKNQKKTDRPVFLPIKTEDIQPVIDTEWMSKGYAFWDGKTPLRRWNAKLHGGVMEFLERASGVGHIHPHRFRDTFAMNLLNKRVDIRSVSRLLGHKDVAVTLRFYEHYILEDQERLIDAMLGE